MRRVVKHAFGIGARIVTGTVGALLILGVIVAWRINAGPVSLGFLAPYLEEALNTGRTGAKVDLGEAELVWGGWDRTLDVSAEKVRLVRDGGQVAIGLPEMTFSLSVAALLDGVVAPTRVQLVAPKVRLLRDIDGGFKFDVAAGAASPYDGLVSWLLDRLVAVPASRGPLGYLNRLSIRRGDLTVDDQKLETIWRIPQIEVDLRRDLKGIAGEARLDLEVEDEIVRLGLAGHYEPSGDAEIAIVFRDVVAAKLAALNPRLRPLELVEAPVSGTVTLGLDRLAALDRVAFDLTAGPGTISLPKPRAHTFAVNGLRMRGRSGDGLNSLQVERIALDLEDSRATVTAEVSGLGGPLAVTAEVAFENLRFADIDKVWPRWLKHKVRRWVAQNLREGRVNWGELSVIVVTKDGLEGLDVTSLTGSMKASGTTVDYLHPMPPARNVSANATFAKDHFFITLESGDRKSVV